MNFHFLVLVLICMLAFAKAHSQRMQEVDQPWWFLLNGGYISGKLIDGDQEENISGFNVGITAEYELSSLLSMDLTANSRNLWMEEESIHYLSPVIQGRLFVADGVSVAAGPGYLFLISDDLDGNLEDGYFSLETDIMLELHSGWLATIAYSYGLGSVTQSPVDSELTFFSFGIGYRFQ